MINKLGVLEVGGLWAKLNELVDAINRIEQRLNVDEVCGSRPPTEPFIFVDDCVDERQTEITEQHTIEALNKIRLDDIEALYLSSAELRKAAARRIIEKLRQQCSLRMRPNSLSRNELHDAFTAARKQMFDKAEASGTRPSSWWPLVDALAAELRKRGINVHD